MSLHAGLLEQARHLVAREAKRPKQVSLRRAVSSAYYALFHLLSRETSGLFAADADVIASLNRTLNHGDMLKVSRHFLAGRLPRALHSHIGGMVNAPSVAPLFNVAQTFIDLQQARHAADYDLAKRFTRVEVRTYVARAERAFADWQTIRKTTYARLYLGCFLLWERWDRDR